MIIHKYSQWEEPEEPPFTLDDLVRAASELMMRYHIGFNEALRHLIEQGLPVNEFLRSGEMESFLDEHIRKLEEMKEELHRRHDLKSFIQNRRRRLDDISKTIAERLKDMPGLSEEFRITARNRSLSGFYNLRWKTRTEDDLASDPDLIDGLDKAMDQAEFLEEPEAFYKSYGDRFKGDKDDLNRFSAIELFRKYEALEKLQNELVEAREKGDIFGVDDGKLKQILGEEAYEKFKAARDETMDNLSKALQETGQVTKEDDGVFKLTPAAARKVGERALRQVFETLKIDGAGTHRSSVTGEGAIESVKTRRYEFGDSIAHLDVPSSMINAMIRGGAELPIRIRTEDMEIHDTYGAARTSIVVMIDMSGSMSRFGRFYNAKKVALALDALVRGQYPEDSVHFVGFATFAKRIAVGEILNLAPEPITFMGGGVNMRVDFAKVKDPERDLRHVPRYFTNLQKGLELSRRILSAEAGRNKEIILITDGAPTAYYEGQYLNLTYPPEEKTYNATLREARACTEAGVVINTFMLGSDYDTGYYGEAGFMDRMLRINRGRLFHPQPESLTQYVLIDYVANKRKLIEI